MPKLKKKTVRFTAPEVNNNFDPFHIIAEQEKEIAKLAKLKDKNGKPVYPDIQEMYNYFKPSEADLKRQYTEDELKVLCLKVKCRVRMDVCNPVEDYAKHFRKQGRLQNRSEKYINKLLTKAVMKNKSTALYSQSDIDEHRQFYWRERRRHNNLLLDLWKYERDRALEQELEFERTFRRDTELGRQLNVDVDIDPSDDSTILDVSDLEPCVVQPMQNANEKNTGKSIIQPMQNTSKNTSTESDDSYINEDDCDALIDIPGELFVESFNSENILANNTHTIEITSQDNLEIIKAGLEVNTESISIDSILNTQEELQSSEVVNSENLPYEKFNSQIPLTSTQSQHSSHP